MQIGDRFYNYFNKQVINFPEIKKFLQEEQKVCRVHIEVMF